MRHDRHTVRPSDAAQRRARRDNARKRSKGERLAHRRLHDPGWRARPRDRRFVDDLSIGSGALIREREQKQHDRQATRPTRQDYSDVRVGFIGSRPALTSLRSDDPDTVVTTAPGPQPIAPLLLVRPRPPQQMPAMANPEETAHAA